MFLYFDDLYRDSIFNKGLKDLLLNFLMHYLFCFTYFYVYECFAWVHVCVPLVCLAPVEAGSGAPDPVTLN